MRRFKGADTPFFWFELRHKGVRRLVRVNTGRVKIIIIDLPSAEEREVKRHSAAKSSIIINTVIRKRGECYLPLLERIGRVVKIPSSHCQPLGNREWSCVKVMFIDGKRTLGWSSSPPVNRSHWLEGE